MDLCYIIYGSSLRSEPTAKEPAILIADENGTWDSPGPICPFGEPPNGAAVSSLFILKTGPPQKAQRLTSTEKLNDNECIHSLWVL